MYFLLLLSLFIQMHCYACINLNFVAAWTTVKKLMKNRESCWILGACERIFPEAIHVLINSRNSTPKVFVTKWLWTFSISSLYNLFANILKPILGATSEIIVERSTHLLINVIRMICRPWRLWKWTVDGKNHRVNVVESQRLSSIRILFKFDNNHLTLGHQLSTNE